MFRGADELRGSGARGRIHRHEAQKDLRAHADPGAAQAYQEKVDGREVADTEANPGAGEVPDTQTDGHAGKVPIPEKEKSLRESDSFGDALSESHCFRQKEKVVAESFTGIFSDGLE